MTPSADSSVPVTATATRKVAQLLGTLISAVTALIWLGVLWLPSERDVLGHFGVVGAVVMLFIALLGTIAAHRGHGNLMIGMFLALFLPVGAFMLYTTEPMYRWLGILNLVYFVTALIVRLTSERPAATPENTQSRMP